MPPFTDSRAVPTVALRAAVLALVVGVLLTAQVSGAFRTLADPVSAAHAIAALGPWGWASFVLAYAFLQPFGVPGTVFLLAAALIWPWPLAYGTSMVGTMAASSLGFLFARFIARDWVSSRLPERFRRYDDALASRAFLTVFLLRFVFWMPPLLHAFFGVSRVRFSTHFWASLAGYLIPVFLMVYFGQTLIRALRSIPLVSGAVALLAIVVVAVIAGYAARRAAARRVRS